jgi:WD40 repeat protein
VARIVCQVLHRSDRVSFLWSEGAAFFEPYHLEGGELARLLDLSGQIHAALATGDLGAAASQGQQLYRTLFRLNAGDPGPAAVVHAWLAPLASGNQIDRLEFLSDSPGLVPWNTLNEGNAPPFWGARFSLGAARRVNALRQNPILANPLPVMAGDVDLIDRISDTQRPLLNPLREAGRLWHNPASLAEELKKRIPDILLLLVRFDQGQLRLGADAFTIGDLQAWLDEAKEGNPDPIVVLMGCGDPRELPAWQALLTAATATFSGLIANETLLPPAQAFGVGYAVAQRLMEGKGTLGEILRSLRHEQPAAGLAFSAFCPPQLQVGGTAVPDTEIESAPLPRLPYRPFAAYDAADRALFFGREEDVIRGALVADQAATNGVFLHGSPAAGKTSYLQAGLLPYLEQESVGYRVLRDRAPLGAPVAEKDYPILILRCTNDLTGQFADALTVFCAQPFTYTTPAGTQVTVDLPNLLHLAVTGQARCSAAGSTAVQASAAATAIAATPDEADDSAPKESEALSPRELWIALRDNKGMLARILDTITRSLPFELVIAVDQGEELLTLVRTPQQQVRRRKALDMLMQLTGAAARCKIVFTLRSQFLAQLESLLPAGRAPADWRSFELRPLTESEMVDALQWPTNREEVPYCEEAPHGKYRFTFDEGSAQQIVAEAIEAAAAAGHSPLPILQAVGGLLYDKQVLGKKQEIVRFGDVKDFGGVKNAVAEYFELVLQRLPVSKAAQSALRALVGKLFTSHADGSLSRDLVSSSDLKSYWRGAREPVEAVVNQAADECGIFEIQQLFIGGESDVYVSLAQDSLATLGKSIDAERDLRAYGKSKIIDTLWIMIPLAFLCATLSFCVTSRYLNKETEEDPDKLQKVADLRARAMMAEKTRRPLYIGQLAQADQALQAENALRARQILVSQPALLSFDDKRDFKLADPRGFEWWYLWGSLHSERHLFLGQSGGVNAVAVSPDGAWAATAGAGTDAKLDGAIRIWDLTDGKLLALVPGKRETVHALAFAPDGKTLASAGADKLVRLWDLSGLKSEYVEIAKEAKTLSGHTDIVFALAYGKDAETLASAGADKSVIVWDVAAGKEKHVLKEHAAAVHALTFVADGKTLASAGAEAQIVLWDVAAGKKGKALKTAYQSIAALALAPDGKTLASGGVETRAGVEMGIIRFWTLADAKDAEAYKPIQHGAGVRAIAFQPDASTPANLAIASAGSDHVIRAFDAKTGTQVRRWIGHLGAVNAIAFAKSGDTLVSGSTDGTAKAWNPRQSSGPEVVRAHDDWVQCLALHAKNKLLASGARDGTVKLWAPAMAALIQELPRHKGAVTAVAFSSHAEKTFLAVGTRDDKDEGEIKIWQIDTDAKGIVTAKETATLKEHKKGITCLAFHPLADRADVLVSGSADATVKVWNIATGKAKSYAGHKAEVRCVAFGPDGKAFASGGKDALICLYELERDDIATVADLHLNSVEALSILPTAGSDEHAQEVPVHLLTGSADLLIKRTNCLKIENGKTLFQTSVVMRTHAQPISGVLFNDQGTSSLIASAGWDGAIKLHDMAGERFTLLGHQGAVRAIAMAADQSFLVSAGNDGTLRFWRAYQERRPAKDAQK